MASTKLSAEDKQAAVALYQEAGQTAATVAEAYGVSVSTISRLLKNELSKDVYDALVKQKRGGGETKSKKRTATRTKTVSRRKRASSVKKGKDASSGAETPEEPAAVELNAVEPDEVAVEEKPKRRKRSSTKRERPVSRRRTRKVERPVAEPEVEEISAEPVLEEIESSAATEPIVETKAPPKLKRDAGDESSSEPRSRRRKRRRSSVRKASVVDEAAVELAEARDSQPLADQGTEDQADEALSPEVKDVLNGIEDALDEELATNDDDAFDDAFDDDDDLDDDGNDNITSLRRRPSGADVVKVLPLSEANLSRMLYLVIDRTADLITVPMQHFSDLGRLPAEEEEKKTLPVFENHRIARRFSQRNQRVIKVPDGQLLSKTAPWLEAKGITRCLLDGQVYSLESFEQD